MEEKPFRVTLSASGGINKKTGIPKSLRFTIPAAVVKAYKIEKDYSVYFHIIGILKEKTQKEPTQVNIPMWAQVSSAGGTSLAITVDKKQVIRYELKKDYELEIIFKEIKKS